MLSAVTSMLCLVCECVCTCLCADSDYGKWLNGVCGAMFAVCGVCVWISQLTDREPYSIPRLPSEVISRVTLPGKTLLEVKFSHYPFPVRGRL